MLWRNPLPLTKSGRRWSNQQVLIAKKGAILAHDPTLPQCAIDSRSVNSSQTFNPDSAATMYAVDFEPLDILDISLFNAGVSSSATQCTPPTTYTNEEPTQSESYGTNTFDSFDLDWNAQPGWVENESQVPPAFSAPPLDWSFQPSTSAPVPKASEASAPASVPAASAPAASALVPTTSEASAPAKQQQNNGHGKHQLSKRQRNNIAVKKCREKAKAEQKRIADKAKAISAIVQRMGSHLSQIKDTAIPQNVRKELDECLDLFMLWYSVIYCDTCVQLL